MVKSVTLISNSNFVTEPIGGNFFIQFFCKSIIIIMGSSPRTKLALSSLQSSDDNRSISYHGKLG